MAKFCDQDESIGSNIWGAMYEGARGIALSAQEQALRVHIQHGTLLKPRARQCLAQCDSWSVWRTRIQFVEASAALASENASDLCRKMEGSKLTSSNLLYNLTAVDRMERLFNNLRFRHPLPNVRLLLPSGATSNEALHAETNCWFRQIQRMHRSTLSLKLLQEICKAYQPDVVVDRRRLVGSLTYCKVGSRLRIVPESWFGGLCHETSRQKNLPVSRATVSTLRRATSMLACHILPQSLMVAACWLELWSACQLSLFSKRVVFRDG